MPVNAGFARIEHGQIDNNRDNNTVDFLPHVVG
jgi:hypothetical protein